MKSDNITYVFLELLKTGLWESTNHNDFFKDNDIPLNELGWSEVYRLATDQSVIGLFSTGLDWFKVHDPKMRVPQEWSLQFIGSTLQIEQRNRAMNDFVAKLITLLRKNDIYTLLVKGQGIAQCYDRPLWRSSGDIDLLLSDSNYEQAKEILVPLATSVDDENVKRKHLALTIDSWIVELHGSLQTGITRKIDRGIDKVQEDIFFNGMSGLG